MRLPLNGGRSDGRESAGGEAEPLAMELAPVRSAPRAHPEAATGRRDGSRHASLDQFITSCIEEFYARRD